MKDRQLTRRVAAGLGIAAVVSMGALTACGGGGKESPSSTTPTTTSTSTSAPTVSPTEKSLNPTGGNLFTPPVKAPSAPTAIPGTHN
ncbi:hypothetical protein CIW52_23255 [Mycolicibacterium sp. P9-64]|uniref:hypothetical protein n=1 Tax=Mycolicibacterium sp. P9-64 TaxID=2024612 RepID=UPI0011EEEAC7|nr:hypothetical protein [Mycolicibacterium sp. P9-64]KAA0080540.1 hypothetical protein CIW52_23255 [Mycolicibacterium sp. P9-64]